MYICTRRRQNGTVCSYTLYAYNIVCFSASQPLISQYVRVVLHVLDKVHIFVTVQLIAVVNQHCLRVILIDNNRKNFVEL